MSAAVAKTPPDENFKIHAKLQNLSGEQVDMLTKHFSDMARETMSRLTEALQNTLAQFKRAIDPSLTFGDFKELYACDLKLVQEEKARVKVQDQMGGVQNALDQVKGKRKRGDEGTSPRKKQMSPIKAQPRLPSRGERLVSINGSPIVLERKGDAFEAIRSPLTRGKRKPLADLGINPIQDSPGQVLRVDSMTDAERKQIAREAMEALKMQMKKWEAAC